MASSDSQLNIFEKYSRNTDIHYTFANTTIHENRHVIVAMGGEYRLQVPGRAGNNNIVIIIQNEGGFHQRTRKIIADRKNKPTK